MTPAGEAVLIIIGIFAGVGLIVWLMTAAAAEHYKAAAILHQAQGEEEARKVAAKIDRLYREATNRIRGES